MPARQRYNKPPITEAIIDLRVDPRPDLALEILKQISGDHTKDYPDIKPMFETTGMMQVEPGIGATASAQQKQTGYRAVSVDGKYVCQRQLGGFTFSRLSPYESWEPFRALAKNLWGTYRAAAIPQSVSRIAVRYINKIDIPTPNTHSAIELKEYFRTGPEISQDLPQAIAGFFMQVQLPQDDISAKVIINQTIVPPPIKGVVSVILDIDLFCDQAVPNDEDSIWSYLEELRVRKDELFESCITDSTRELFN